MIDAGQILKRFERMKAERYTWETLWQTLADYIHPRRSLFQVVRTPGQSQTEFLFDSTALDAHDRLASTLNGTLTSRAAEWFSLTMRDDTLNANQDIRTWLEECGKRMFRAFNQSNFAQEIHEVYLDETAFGTAALFLEERSPEKVNFAGFVFRAIPLHELFIDEDSEGRVNTVYYRFQLTAAAAVDKWGINNLGEKVQKAIEDGKSEKLFTFLHAVYPRNSNEPKIGTPKTKMPWASIYVCIEDKYGIAEGGFQEFPFMVPRWSKSAGEKYGRGPGHLALPDVKTLNRIKQITLKMMGKVLDPPTVSEDDSIVGKILQIPGGNTVVRNMERAIKPLYPPGHFREALGNENLKSSELIAAVRRYFYADQMELPVGPAMTAFEVAKRFELLQRLLGPTMGRQETELLNPLIDRAFGIMFRHQALPAPPQILLEQGSRIDVQYEGPLAKSQRLSEVEGLERLQQIVVGIAQVDPSVIDNINYDEAVRIAADVLGVPTKLLNDPDQVQQMRQQRQQQQEAQQKLANVGAIAQAAGKAAPALKIASDAAGQWGGIPAGGSSGAAAA